MMSDPEKTALDYLNNWRNANARVTELEAENTKLQTHLARLKLRATAVVEDNPFCTYRKPDATDCYGVNGVLLWLLRQNIEEVEDEVVY